jgi:hypothetical protein
MITGHGTIPEPYGRCLSAAGAGDSRACAAGLTRYRRAVTLDIKDELHRKLKVGRANLLANLDDLGEYDLRRPVTPTGTNLLGLVKHLAGLEYGYLGDCVGRSPRERLVWMDDGSVGEGADMWAKPTESKTSIVGLYRRLVRMPMQRSMSWSSTLPLRFRGGLNRRRLWVCCW